MVVPVPLLGQMGGEPKAAPSEVAEQPATEAIPLPMSKWVELPATLVASTTAGGAQPDEVLPIEAEVMVAMTDGS